MSPSFIENRALILKRLEEAHESLGPDALKRDITLVAVSKQQPDVRIDEALAAGQRVFGENRVQEAFTRWAARREAYPDLELRLIGPLQTNKAKDAVALFDVIETLDREKLAGALKKAMDETGRSPRLYVQVNTGDEAQKAGLGVDEVEAFVAKMRTEYGLTIEGLMCIPPVEEPASLHFALLAKLAKACGVEKLSMGMSGDYDVAAKLGATSVRVGSALFGERAKPE
ncbi:YggS family pyridoxal phosphate-dependent enzyme [Woodsholea maritima]|uniref:YggS family pyridoxal phosphate-dependent enzyme n=1 Tax=Woodsholea maritima TaxID=240237 RepID=UPI00037931ED|nr:YggS family pyridoxal phosphate-dependent enzyme [Woodsholea maritima]